MSEPHLFDRRDHRAERAPRTAGKQFVMSPTFEVFNALMVQLQKIMQLASGKQGTQHRRRLRIACLNADTDLRSAITLCISAR